ncbi:MAG: nitrous oxide reductase family maturation protein NosD [Solirubrobacterales bacterium]
MVKRITILAALAMSVPCWAGVLTVDDDGPADYRTIQEAIDNARHGDVVVVKQGTYRERITFGGRWITVRSEDPADPLVVQATVISSESVASVVFDSKEGEHCVLTGLTVTGAGILCNGASPTISGNIIRDCAGAGIEGKNSAKPIVVDNRILDNELEGVYSCGGLIQGNVISGNNAGLGSCGGTILDNVIANNRDAGGLYSCNGEIARNTITGNTSATDGGGLADCGGQIHHNIVAGNRALLQGGGLFNCGNAIVNNTIVGNRAGGVGGAMSQGSATLCNNIIAFNEASAVGGVNGSCTSTYNMFWGNSGENVGGGAAFGVGDIVADPRFISGGYWHDNGTLNPDDDFWVDGDHHLRSQVGRWDPPNECWAVDSDMSPCIDAGRPGSSWTEELWPHGKRINLGAYGGTSQASMSLSTAGRLADLDHDDKVGFSDVMLFSQSWLATQMPAAEDLDREGEVNLRDFAVLAADWRTDVSQTPPTPSPMTFAVAPFATSPYSIAMIATAAVSTDGTGVEYYFEDYSSPEVNSGWLYYDAGQEPRWEDVGLTPERPYWYHVKARNRGNGLETEWSERKAAVTDAEDSTPPTPSPMTWQTEPYGVSTDTIRMVATTAVDESGVEYQFDCTSHPDQSSDWQDSAAYEATGLAPGYYKFRVRARDKSVNSNATEWSKEVVVDLLAPTPNPMTWASEPREYHSGAGTFEYSVKMTATEATDDSGEVEYFFQCTTESGFNSGWQSSREYKVKVGRANQRHCFRVKARDLSPSRNETAWSSELPAQ